MPYPWNSGDPLVANDLNAAIAGATTGALGPAGPIGTSFLAGSGPPTEDAPEGSIYLDVDTGDIWQFGTAAPVVPPATGYHAGAVHFNGASWLVNNVLSATNNGMFSFVGWFKHGALPTNSVMWVVDPDGDYNNFLSYTNTGQWNALLRDPVVGTTIYGVHSSPSTGVDGGWYCLIYTVDTNFSVGLRKGRLYVGDVDQTIVAGDVGGPFQALIGGIPFFIGSDGYGVSSSYLGDIADLRIMPGVSLLDGSGDIPEATRRLFIGADGKPVDPAVATATLGAPRILFSGDAATFGTNQGTGGAFTLTGTLTDATSSPSD